MPATAPTPKTKASTGGFQCSSRAIGGLRPVAAGKRDLSCRVSSEQPAQILYITFRGSAVSTASGGEQRVQSYSLAVLTLTKGGATKRLTPLRERVATTYLATS